MCQNKYESLRRSRRSLQIIQCQKPTVFCTLLKDRILYPHSPPKMSSSLAEKFPEQENSKGSFPFAQWLLTLIWMPSDYSDQPCLQLLQFFIYEHSYKQAFCSHKCLLKGYFSYEYLHSDGNKGIHSNMNNCCYLLFVYSYTRVLNLLSCISQNSA